MTALLSELSAEERKNILFTGLGFILILMSYPFIRVPVTTLFLHTHTATKSPLVWTLSVLTLCLFIGIYNKLQKRFSVRKLYLGSTLFSLFVFAGAPFLLSLETYYTTCALFVWKEAYIMLMLSLITGFLNVSISGRVARVIWGPLGFAGSLGGIIGGIATSFLSGRIPVEYIPVIGTVFIFLSFAAFGQTSGRPSETHPEAAKKSPLAAILDVKQYASLIALLIIATQFFITIANFKFNVLFDTLITEKAAKSRYLADLYTQVNVLACLIQVFVTPFLLHRVSIKNIHFCVPVTYMGLCVLPLLFSGTLWPVAIFFIAIKGIDYSLFSASKEILYFSLNTRQKYGAKYIADGICYRLGKGLISFVLIYVQSPIAVDTMLWTCLVLWIVLLYLLFKAKEDVTR